MTPPPSLGDIRRDDELLDSLGQRRNRSGDELAVLLRGWTEQIDQDALGVCVRSSRWSGRSVRQRVGLRAAAVAALLGLTLSGASVAAAVTGTDLPVFSQLGSASHYLLPRAWQPAPLVRGAGHDERQHSGSPVASDRGDSAVGTAAAGSSTDRSGAVGHALLTTAPSTGAPEPSLPSPNELLTRPAPAPGAPAAVPTGAAPGRGPVARGDSGTTVLIATDAGLVPPPVQPAPVQPPPAASPTGSTTPPPSTSTPSPSPSAVGSPLAGPMPTESTTGPTPTVLPSPSATPASPAAPVSSAEPAGPAAPVSSAAPVSPAAPVGPAVSAAPGATAGTTATTIQTRPVKPGKHVRPTLRPRVHHGASSLSAASARGTVERLSRKNAARLGTPQPVTTSETASATADVTATTSGTAGATGIATAVTSATARSLLDAGSAPEVLAQESLVPASSSSAGSPGGNTLG